MAHDNRAEDAEVQQIDTTDPNIDDQYALYRACNTVIERTDSNSDAPIDSGTINGPRIRINLRDRHDNPGTVTGHVNHAEIGVLPDQTRHAVIHISMETDYVAVPVANDRTETATSRYGAVAVTDPKSTPTGRGLRGAHLLDDAYGERIGKFGVVTRLRIHPEDDRDTESETVDRGDA